MIHELRFYSGKTVKKGSENQILLNDKFGHTTIWLIPTLIPTIAIKNRVSKSYFSLSQRLVCHPFLFA